MIGAPPSAPSNIRLNVEKLAKVGEANGQGKRDQRHRHDRSLGELQHTHGFRLHLQEQLRGSPVVGLPVESRQTGDLSAFRGLPRATAEAAARD